MDMCIYNMTHHVCGVGHVAYSDPREASAGLLVLLRWAIPGPQGVERAADTALTLFL